MSLTFNDATTYKGIIQEIERSLGFNQGDISGDTALFKHFTALVNMALDDFTELAIKSSGKWQWDDSNQTDAPIIYTDLIASQKNYSFTTDANTNLILEIYKVLAKSSSNSAYQLLTPVDAQSDLDNPLVTGMTDGLNISGVPVVYDKTAKGITLYPVPSTTITNGLKIYINREASYFTTADTTRKPGTPGIFHEYFALKPAYKYARNKTLANMNLLEVDVERMEKKIKDYYAERSKDERSIMTGRKTLYI